MPVYECRPEGVPPDDSVTIAANSPRHAAEVFRARHDAEFCEWVYESCVIVAGPDGVESTWVVTCEAVPTYTVKLKKGTT